MKRACATCGGCFKCKPSASRKFCTRQCAGLAARKPGRECARCGVPFRPRRPESKFCSVVCGLRPRKAPDTCLQCGAEYRSRRGPGSQKYCSARCASAAAERGPALRRARARTYRAKAYPARKARLMRPLFDHWQHGRCAICRGPGTPGPPDGKRKLCLDHCHVTGIPRAVLCGQCNTAVGAVRESPRIARALVEYVVMCRSLITVKGPDQQ